MAKMPEEIRRAAVAGSVLLSVLLVMLFLVPECSIGRGQHRLVGEPAPPFKLRALRGNPHGPAAHKGRMVLLDFWATWCGPCKMQMPIAAMVARNNPDVALLPVNVDAESADRASKMLAFLNETAPGTNSLLDDGSVQRMYGVRAYPTLMLIDWKGNVRWVGAGVSSKAQLESVIDGVRRGSLM